MNEASDSKLLFIKVARILTYIIYAYAVIASVFLILGFILLLFGANQTSGFVNFVYNIAAEFLKPFREIFPGQAIGNKGYFSASALFAIVMYGIAALALHSLITFITLKQTEHQSQLRHYTEAKSVSELPEHSAGYEEHVRPVSAGTRPARRGVGS